MPKRSMETLTESMFYVLLAFTVRPLCGIEAAAFIEDWTKGRVQVGPATLYTILGKFEKEGYLKETAVVGRKRTYAITDKGRQAYLQELDRLQACLNDARRLPPPTVPAGEGAPLSPAPSLA